MNDEELEKIISTHAPYTEGDLAALLTEISGLFQLTPPIQRATKADLETAIISIFQLTPPIQRATKSRDSMELADDISTHAPYTEGDVKLVLVRRCLSYFNSRPLYRGRHHA